MPDIRSFFGGASKRKATPGSSPSASKKRKIDAAEKQAVQKTKNPAKDAAQAAQPASTGAPTPAGPQKPLQSTPASTLGNAPTDPGPSCTPSTLGGEADDGYVDTWVDKGEVSKLSFDVLKERYRVKYCPITDAGWKKGKKMPYLALAEAFEKVSSTTKRLEKVEIVSKLLRSVICLNPELLLQVLYLCVNEFAPPYVGLELGVGDQVIIKALAESTGRSTKDMKAEYVKLGDLGIVAVKSRGKQKTMFPPPPLDVKGVFDKLKKVAATTGNKSMAEKCRLLQGLFVSCKGNESKFIVRHVQGKMRMGLAEQTVFAALGRALAYTPIPLKGETQISDMMKQKGMSVEKMHERQTRVTNIICQVFSEVPNYDVVIPALLSHGVDQLHRYCHLTPGIPIKAMLAKPTTGIQEILKRFNEMRFTLEYKYDGERAQIHLMPNGDIMFFSRNAEDNSSKFPDLKSRMSKYCKDQTKSFILDSEVVAYDREKKQILPFQVLMHRKRKDVEEKDVTIQVCIYAFDCLYMNGESLINKPFGERRKVMYDAFNVVDGEFFFADHKDSKDPEEIEEYLNQSIKDQCEGLMVKTLWKEATYEPAKRSHNWLKCKKDYLEGCGDSLDLVVIGAFYGTGKRTGKYGSFLVACYDEEEDVYQSICKIGTGFSDDDLTKHHASLSQILLPKKATNYMVTDNFKCDVWFDAQQVWEVKCADLTISPAHMAGVGRVHEEKGIALRFPRFIRIREDKKPEDATNGEQVAELYLAQANLGQGFGGPPRR